MATAPQAGTAKKKTAVKTADPSTSSTKIKTAAKPAAAAKKAPTSTKPKSRGNGAGTTHHISADQRRNYIEVAAYYIAERRGFIGGNVVDDWAAAEIEVDRLLTEGKLNG